MTTHVVSAAGQTAPYRRGRARRTNTDPATAIAVTLFLAVLIAEAVFLAFNTPSAADLAGLAAAAGSVP